MGNASKPVGLLGLTGSDKKLLVQLINKFSLKLITLKKGEKESIVMTEKEQSFLEVPKVKIDDTVAAGDSFTVVLVAGLLNKIELTKIRKTATQVAAFVCTQNGAMPEDN